MARWQTRRLVFLWRSNEEPEKFAPARESGEDYWISPLRPVAATMYQRLPYLPDPDATDFPKFFPAREEDYYGNPVPPVQATLYRWPPVDGDDLPVTVAASFQPEEDYWLNVAPPAPAQPKQPIAEAEDAPILFGQFDEDFWVSGVAPLPGALYRDPVSRDPEDVPALYGQYEEDYWLAPIPQPGAIFRQPFVDDDLPVFVAPPPPITDEDYWQNPLPPPVVMFRSTVVDDELPVFTTPPPPPSLKVALFIFDE